MTLPQNEARTPVLCRYGLRCKLWPNGQIVFYRRSRKQEQAASEAGVPPSDNIFDCINRAYSGQERLDALDSLGLSNVANSDKPPQVSRSGLSGITSLGKSRVRNAAYMMKASVGKHRLTFSTVTIPPLSTEETALLHVNWHKVIERYRLEVRRVLVSAGLSGEIVGVTEIQEKRYEQTGLPYLHAHFLFVGFAKSGGWALSPKRHDIIWRKCIYSAIGRVYGPEPCFSSACNLQSIKKDPAGYLSKYMSKGVEVTSKVVADGLEWWLPRQWWNCSISLVKRMNKEMRVFTHGVHWLLDRAEDGCRELFVYYRTVSVVMPSGNSVPVAGVGSLSPPANRRVRQFLGL